MKKNALIIITFAIALITTNITFSQSNSNGMKKIKFDSGINENDAITKFLSLNNFSSENTFELIRSTKDKMGYTHNRYQQYFKGIKVEFGTLITHQQNGLVNAINAEIYDASNLNLTPVLSSNNALLNTVDHLAITKAVWYDATARRTLEQAPEGELVIVPNYQDNLQSVILAYKFKVEANEPFLKGDSYVNADNGTLNLFNPTMKHYDRVLGNTSSLNKTSATNSNSAAMRVTGTADTRYLGQQTIETRQESDGTFTLNDDVNSIFTRDALNQDPSNFGTQPYFTNFEEFTDNDNNWTDAEFNNFGKDNAALDAHYGAFKVKEYWQTIHSRDSYDDNGAPIFSYIHVGSNYFNAFWDGTAMSYGDGNNNPLTTFDICAHEIGHAVTSNSANLVYANQSGGLNEGYSDIWGAAIQHYAYGSGTDATPDNSVWAIGEDIGAIRSMSDPKAFGDPDTYLGTNWRTTGDEGTCTPSQANDQCGVHSNSGVLNHWFHILVAGKAATNDLGDVYDVTGIGMIKAEEIAYLALRDYLTPNSTFAEAREATLSVASNLYCANSDEVMNVHNAWFAVNVGDAFTAIADDVALKSIISSTGVNCGVFATPEVTIENGGTNTITSIELSYSVNGNTPVTETIATDLPSCETTTYDITGLSLSTGINNLSVTTTITNDGRAENNTKSINIIINDTGTENEVNTFENPTDVLLAFNDGDTSTSLWERGVASGTLLQDGSNKVYGTDLDANHPDNTKAFLVSQCYDLSSISNAVLKFKMGFDLEANWDIVYMEYSTDRGSNWNVLGTANDPNWYNSDRTNASSGSANDCQNCPGAQWTGQGETTNSGGITNATLQEYSYVLSDFDTDSTTPASDIMFRFTFHSDAAVNEEGVIIDDFVIEGNSLSVEENIFENFSYYPNPTNGTLQVSLSSIIGSNENIKIDVYDISGRNVYSKSHESTTDFTTSLDLNNLTSGVYLMNINQGNKDQIAKIVIN